MKARLFAILWVIIGFTPVAGQIDFERLTTANGLSQNDVNSILRDKQGYMWFGTNNGLNRYDGYNFEQLTKTTSNGKGIKSSLAHCLAEDSKGRIWIGTTGQGIWYYDTTTDTYVDLSETPEIKALIGSGRISKLVVDELDRIFFVAVKKGVGLIVKKEQGWSVKYLDKIPKKVNDIAIDYIGNLWVASEGLWKVTSKEKEFAQYDLKKVSVLKYKNISVRSMLSYKDKLYIMTFKGLYRSKLKQGRVPVFKKVSEQVGNEFNIDTKGGLWVGSSQGLTYSPVTKNGKFKKLQLYKHNWTDSKSLSKNSVRDIYVDQTGVVWIGTLGGGVNVVNPRKKKIRHYRKNLSENSLSDNRISAIFEDSEKNLWVGTSERGVNLLFHSDTANYMNGYNHIRFADHSFIGEGDWVNVIAEVKTAKGKLIICGGVQKYKLHYAPLPKSGKLPKFEGWKHSHGKVFAIKQTRNRIIWIATYDHGLIRMTNFPDTFSILKADIGNKNALQSNIIRSLTEDDAGNLWIGTSNGLSVISYAEIDKKEPKIITFQSSEDDNTTISHNYILPIWQVKKNTIWVGTMSGGLNKVILHKDLRKTTFEQFTQENGLPSNSVRGILNDKFGNLWLSTTRGLCKMNPKNKMVVNYDMADGLQDNEFSEMAYCKRRKGEMVFGGVNGINVFFPSEIGTNTTPPAVLFTQLKVNNTPIGVGNEFNGRVLLPTPLNNGTELVLEPHERDFSVSFVGLHYESPADNIYRYKLQGFDKNWLVANTSNRVARYTNISPGTYTLKVKAANSDGLWVEKPIELQVTILSPLYQRWWAYVIYVGVLIGLVLLREKYSIIATNEKNELLVEHLEQEKTKELTRTKLQFFTNISHELRTPLTLITAPLSKIHQGYNNISEAEKKRLLGVMYKNSAYLLRLINQLLDFRKMESGKKKLKVTQGNIDSYCNEIVEAFSFAATEQKIELRYSNEPDFQDVWLDFGIVEKVLFNLISNALKYTKGEGVISLSLAHILTAGKSQISISVTDTGIGIPKEEIDYVFDRFYRMNSAQTVKIEGTGIGLSYVKNLVELHHGTILCESEMGAGSTFTVQLPNNKTSYSDAEIKTHKREVEPSLVASLQPTENSVTETESENNYKILVVEDNPDILSLIKNQLSNRYNVSTAENGQIAFDMVKAGEYDLIISDVMMPVMDGLELTRKVKEDQNTCHIPIVLLTAKIADENKIEGYKTGADAYLPKPFNLDVLETRIENILKQRKVLQQKYQRNIYAKPHEVTALPLDEKFLQKILTIIEENIGNSNFTVNQLAIDAGYSQPVLNKKLKPLVGLSPRMFIRNVRLKRAAQLLELDRYSISQVTYEVGFNDLKHFRNCFKEEFNVTPSDYIRHHRKKLQDEKEN